MLLRSCYYSSARSCLRPTCSPLRLPLRARNSPYNIPPALRKFTSSTKWRIIAPIDSLSQETIQSYRNSLDERMPETSDRLFWDHPQQYIGETVTINGFLGRRTDISTSLSFAQLHRAAWKEPIQIVSRKDAKDNTHQMFKNIKANSAVTIKATVAMKRASKKSLAMPTSTSKPASHSTRTTELVQGLSSAEEVRDIELVLQEIKSLSSFPDDIIVSSDSRFGPEQRHLQIRFDEELAKRLVFRSQLTRHLRDAFPPSFTEVETPILFKSTPEGAREFLVPTRRAGYAYALPQSPQQYKQILMASGLGDYFQFAKCFRDEDLRADRQPEFTQLDIEMPFSAYPNIKHVIEKLVTTVYTNFNEHSSFAFPPDTFVPFQTMLYQDAMAAHGVDKPDLRIKDLIRDMSLVAPQNLLGMMTSLKDCLIDGVRFRISNDPATTRAFVKQFMDSPEAAPFQQNPDGPPGVFVYDPTKPLEGLQAFAHEGVEKLHKLYGDGAESPHGLQPGDLLVLQARPNLPFSGGSTALGRLRTAIHRAAVAEGHIAHDPKHYYLWVTDFPLFTLNSSVASSEPGQGGSSGFAATHHPFTAPKTAKDFDLLFTDPLACVADHYDLVVNGVELGGGSKRIHNADIQKYVMRDVLKMSEERLADFDHLFEALRSGCPPHAGIALGLDRWVAVLMGRESVRDVIAFPKGGKGEDALVGSPSVMTKEQQAMYHIEVTEQL